MLPGVSAQAKDDCFVLLTEIDAADLETGASLADSGGAGQERRTRSPLARFALVNHK